MTRSIWEPQMRVATLLLVLGSAGGLAMISAIMIWSPAPDWSELGHQKLLSGTKAAGEEAVGLFQKAIAVDPASPYHWADLGEAYDETGRMNEAAHLFDHAVELGPASPPVLLRAGFHWLKANELQK